MAVEGRSRSAEVVAAERALLSDMGAIDDPLARRMLGPTIGAVYRVARRWPGRVPTLRVTLAGLAARVLWHDRQVLRALSSGIDQVAVVGAGYDSRPWRLSSSGVQFFELDHPATQAEKVRRAPEGGPTYVAVDLSSDSAVEALARCGFDNARPAAIVVEGVTMYLHEEEVRGQLSELAGALAAGSVLTTDFYPPQAAGTVDQRRQNWVQRFARSGSGESLRLLVDRADAAALVGACGWRVDEVMGARDAARALVPPASGLPVDSVNNAKSLISATRR